jgi:hypothetical protein
MVVGSTALGPPVRRRKQGRRRVSAPPDSEALKRTALAEAEAALKQNE